MAGKMRSSSHEGDETARSAEQLALVHAAMLEELGIGRKDTLPLQDRGPVIPLNRLNALKPGPALDPNDPVAAWRNVQFDHVDSMQDQLDSIADGQLYRIRRGASTAMAPGRGRGGPANRGGHAYTSRGGHKSATGRGSYQGSTMQIPAPSSYSKAHGDVRRSARIEAAINRLRDEPSQTMPASKKRSRRGKDAQQTHQPVISSRPSARNDQLVKQTRYGNLVDPTQFVSHFTKTLSSSQSTVSHEELQENRRPVALAAQTDPLQSSALPSNLAKIDVHQPIKPAAGLSSSMWAPSVASPFEHVTQVPKVGYIISHQQAPSANQANPLPAKGDKIFEKEKLAEAVDDLIDLLPKEGLSASRWSTNSASSAPKDLFTGHSAARSVVSNTGSDAVKSTTTTTKSGGSHPSLSMAPPITIPPSSAVPTNVAPTPVTSSSNAPQISTSTFGGLPASLWAPALMKPLVSIRTHPVKVRKDKGERQLGTLKLLRSDNRSPLILAIDTNESGERILEGSVFTDAVFSAKDDIITFKAKPKGDSSPVWDIEFPLPFHARGVYNAIISDPYRPVSTIQTRSTVTETTSTQVRGHSNAPVTANRSSAAPDAQLAPMKMDIDKQFFELAIASESTELISTSPTRHDEHSNDVNHRISTRTFNLLNSLEGAANLVEIDDEDGESAAAHNDDNEQTEEQAIPSALMDLSVLNDDFVVQSIFKAIDFFYDPFLNRLFTTVGNTKLSRDAAITDLLSSRQHVAAAEHLIREFMKESQVFSRLKEDETAAYITDLGWKILAKALMERDQMLEEDAINDANLVIDDKPSQHTISSMPEPGGAPQSDTLVRRNYSVEELVNLRGNAVVIKDELLSKEDMGSNRPTKERFPTRKFVFSYASCGLVSKTEPRPTTNSTAATTTAGRQSLARAGGSAENPRVHGSTPLASHIDSRDLDLKSTVTRSSGPPSVVQTWQQMFSDPSDVGPQSPTKEQSAPPPAIKSGWSASFTADPIPTGLQWNAAFGKQSKPQVLDEAPVGQTAISAPQAQKTVAKAVVSARDWQAFGTKKSEPDPENCNAQPIVGVKDKPVERASIDSPKKTSTGIQPQLVEVYPPHKLTATTSTGDWKSWAKSTSGLEPAVRPPSLVTPTAVTSIDGWQNFVTKTSATTPESSIQQSTVVSDDFQAPTKPLAPHLRYSQPVAVSQARETIQSTTKEPLVRKEPSPSGLKEVESEPVAPKAKITQGVAVTQMTRNVNEEKQTQLGGVYDIQQTSTRYPARLMYELSEAEAQQEVHQPEYNKTSGFKPTESISAWQAFADIKSTTDAKGAQNIAPTAAPKSSPDTDTSRGIDPGFKAISSDLAPMTMTKSVVKAVTTQSVNQSPRRTGHLPTPSDFDRLGEAFQGLRIENNEDAKPSFDFYTAPSAIQPNTMATSYEPLKHGPGLSASRFASNYENTQLPFPKPQAPRHHVTPASAADEKDRKPPSLQDQNVPNLPDEKPIKFKQRPQLPFPQPRPPRPYVSPVMTPTASSPIMQYTMPGSHQTTYVQGGYQIPAPITPEQPSTPLGTQTILVPDPKTGILIEVTGYVKASFVASFPENTQATPTIRPPLSPVRQGENAQAALQRRLTQSLIDRTGSSA